jgi:type II secretory pathway pseudopilin PulG
MKKRCKQSGRTLAEMAVVITVIVLLGSIGLPAIRAFLNSFVSGTGARPVISAALASARAIAAKEQKYAGIRFQKAYDTDGILKADQYMIFIVQDPSLVGTYGYGFRAVDGIKPVRLPKGIGVMDLRIVADRNEPNPVNPSVQLLLDDPDPAFTLADRDDWLNELRELTDTTTFSIIFSPSGKLVIHGVRVWNRNNQDDVFNSQFNVEVAKIAMFILDDYFEDMIPNLGLGPEPSRRSFIIYDRKEFKQAYERGQAYSGYLMKLVPDKIYVNPYTGTMIEK